MSGSCSVNAVHTSSTKPLSLISDAPESVVACRQQVVREQMLVALPSLLPSLPLAFKSGGSWMEAMLLDA